MKRFLKITALTLSIILILSAFFACGGEKQNDPEGSADPSSTDGEIEDELLYTEYDTSCIKKMGTYKGEKITKDLTVTELDVLTEYQNIVMQINAIDETDESTEEAAIKLKNDFKALLSFDGTVNKYDLICFDYTGYLDGEEFSGGKASEVIEIMGSDHFVPTFEDQIIGHKAGESFDINVTFPENYNEQLAGKATVFKIKINYVIPGITDETAKIAAVFMGKDFSTASAFKDAVKAEIKANLEAEFEEYFISDVLKNVYDNTEFEGLPQEDIDAVAVQLESSAAYYGLDTATYMYYMYGITEQSDIDEYCRYQVALQYLIAKIIQEEKLEISDEEYQSSCSEYSTMYGFETVADLEAAAGKNTLKNMIFVEKLSDFITENWTVEVKE